MAEAGLACLEWIYDAYGEGANPLETDAGIVRIRSLAQANGVAVLSVCADWFMDFPLVRAEPAQREVRTARLLWLLERCRRLGANRVVVPFVDASRIDTDQDLEQALAALGTVLPAAESTQVEIHLETSLPPNRFAQFLARIDHPLLKVNYDSGNSSSLGYRPVEEFSAYGSRVGSIHIKDRILGAGTVPLGRGDADFPALFQAVQEVGYAGDFILQAARGEAGKEVDLAHRNRQFILDCLARAGARR